MATSYTSRQGYIHTLEYESMNDDKQSVIRVSIEYADDDEISISLSETKDDPLKREIDYDIGSITIRPNDEKIKNLAKYFRQVAKMIEGLHNNEEQLHILDLINI
jgi:hypothetical protein